MGRPPIGKTAMSGAERQQRYLARLLAGKTSVTKPDGRDARIAELEAELARERAKPAKPSVTKLAQPVTRSYRREAGEFVFSETGKLKAQIDKLKSDIVKLKAMLQQEPDAAKLRQKVIDQQVEMAGLRRALKQTAKDRDQYQSKVARMRLKKYAEARRLLIPKNHSIIVKALHSDRLKQCSTDELREAERLAVALRPLFDEADD